jgi:hypothetical protein
MNVVSDQSPETRLFLSVRFSKSRAIDDADAAKMVAIQTVLIRDKFADFGLCVPSALKCSGRGDSLPEQACSFRGFVVHAEKGGIYLRIRTKNGDVGGAGVLILHVFWGPIQPSVFIGRQFTSPLSGFVKDFNTTGPPSLRYHVM